MKTATRVQNRDMRLAIAQSVNKRDYVNEVLGTGAKPFDGFTARDTVKTPEGKDYASTVKSPLKFNLKKPNNI